MTAEWILTATVLMLAVVLVRSVLGRRMGPKLRYGLWLLVLLRLLLPFTFGQSAASPANLVRVQEETAFVVPIVTGTPEEVGVTVEPDGTVLDANSMGHAAVNPGDGTVSRYTSTFDLKEEIQSLLPKIWVVGMAASACWFLFCNLVFYRDLRRSRTLLRTEGRLRIYVAKAPSPCLFGLISPAVYVTPEAAADPAMLEHTLLHEKTHLRHGDHIWAFLRTVCLILWWYHPLVWLSARLSRRDSEFCCDAAVIARLGEEHRADYGRTLLALAAKGRTAAAFCAASTLSRGGRQLKARITAIARWARPKTWAIILAILLTALAVGCAFTGAAQPPEAPADVDNEAVEEEPADAVRAPGPLTDADLKGGETVHLGMSFDQVDALLSFTEAEYVGNALGMQSYLRGDTLYTFYRDDSGWKFWLMALSTETEENFLGLGVGVGSTLDEVVTLLGCDPADDPGAAQTWQLYGAEGERNSAQVFSGETGGDRFLAVWTESGNLQFQLRQDVVIQAVVHLDNTASWRPVSDVDLVSIHGLTPGMAYDEAMDHVGTSATVTESTYGTQVERDGLLYLFRDLRDGMQLLSYSSNVPGTELPLGLTVGGSIDTFLRDNLGMVELPALPLTETRFLYGSGETSMSALLDKSYGDSPGDLKIYTERFLFHCRLNEDRTILYADCSDRTEPSALLRFKTAPEFQECTALDAVDFNQYSGYSGAVVYTQNGSAPQVAYCVQGYNSHFTVAELPGIGRGVEYQPGSLRQLSGEEIALSLKDTATGQLTQWQIAPRWNDDGTVTFASGPVPNSPEVQPETPAADDSAADDSVAPETATPTTQEEFLARLAADVYLRKTEVLGCVMFEGPSPKIDGAALCRRPDTGSLWVVFSTPDTERQLFPTGIGNPGELDYVDGSFGYADGDAHLTVYHRRLGQNLEETVSCFVTPEGNPALSGQTSPLILSRYASFGSGQVLDWLELPDGAEADGVLVISADGSGMYPQVCYCYDITAPQPRFVYSNPVEDLRYETGSLRRASGDQVAISLEDPETGRADQWQVVPTAAADGTVELSMAPA